MKIFKIKFIAPSGQKYTVERMSWHKEYFNEKAEAEDNAKRMIKEFKMKDFKYEIVEKTVGETDDQKSVR